jgi:hypothetical protein
MLEKETDETIFALVSNHRSSTLLADKQKKKITHSCSLLALVSAESEKTEIYISPAISVK